MFMRVRLFRGCENLLQYVRYIKNGISMSNLLNTIRLSNQTQTENKQDFTIQDHGKSNDYAFPAWSLVLTIVIIMLHGEITFCRCQVWEYRWWDN